MKPTSPQPRGRKVNPKLAFRRREEILDAATRLFAERGYSETDTQVLANELGVGKGTLYRYFPSKRELFLAVADRVMRRLYQRIDNRLAGVDDPFERIAVGIRGFLGFCAEHPEFVELLIQERALFKDCKKSTYFEHREARLRRWQEWYRTLIGEGRIRDIPVERITDVVSILLYGTLFTNYFALRHKPWEVPVENLPDILLHGIPWEAQAEDLLDILLHGILSPAERRHRGLDSPTAPPA